MATVRRRATALAAPPITEADLRALSARHGEPAWLLELRLAAWAQYEAMPMPTSQDEEMAAHRLSPYPLGGRLVIS